MRFRRAAVAIVLVALATAWPMASAGAQDDGPTAQEIADRGGRAVAYEAAQLLALGALSGQTDRLASVLAPYDLADPPSQEGLLAADDAGAAIFAQLMGLQSSLSADVRRALQPLDEADRAAAASGGQVSITAEVYLRALDHLRDGAGAPPASAAPPDLDAIAAWLATLDLEQGLDVPTSAPPSTAPTTAPEPATSSTAATEPTTTAVGTEEPAASGDGLPWALLVGAVAAGALVIALVVALARRSASSPAAPVAADPKVDRLLEVSRRLTAAPADEVDRAIVREALGLVPADGAALVHQDGSALSVGHASHPELLVADHLGDGIIRRAAETGQQVSQVSATEPAIRNLPVALVCTPLVGGGRVEAVLVLARSSDRAFVPSEAALLSAMAPVAAASLHSAQTARAAIEDSLIDGLTGVGNRRRFDMELAATLAEGRELGATTALAIVDLDHFKSVNDTYGHQAGDAVLQAVVEVLRTTVRPQDAVYRFGGEEFCILMADTDLAAAADVAERLRAAVAARPFDVGADEPLRRTASFGVSAATDGDAEALIARADEALYAAKAGGRDRVVAGR
ncbi:MAG: sensor domain-containing diguanylate cyclase [Acidimicrobiales bacterium]|nr:sensor domain-containing diguanylate cyclase [Acidimicrobiales bacterium]